MNHKRFTILIGLFLAGFSVMGQTGNTEGLTLKQRLHMGETIKQVRVPTHASREEVLALIREQDPDMLYLDARPDADRSCRPGRDDLKYA